MALLSAVTGGNLTKVRANKYHTTQYVALVPDEIVCQATVATAPTLNVWAQLTINTPSSGSVAAIKSFQTVIFSTSSDYRATETYRTYMRAGSSGTTLNIAQNSQALAVNDHVTILNTYEVFEKPAAERAGTLYFDWDIEPRRILPIETALPSAVVITDGATSYQPSPTVNGLDDNANSSWTYTWSSSNGSDSFDDTTLLSPTITLQAASFRWLRFEFTNTGTGLTGLRVIPVWTVPADYSSVVSLGFGDESGGLANISYDRELGFTCDIPAWDGIDDVLSGTFLCVFSENWYNNTEGAIRTNIDFVGYLGEERTVTRGDEPHGVISETRFNCNSIGALISETPVSTLSITATTSPTAWFDIDNPTPIRVAHFMLTELSTVGHLCSMSYFSGHTSFVGNGDVFSETPDVLFDALREILDTVNAVIQYDVNGRLDVVRNLNELDTAARNAATTVVQFQTSDWLDYTFVDNPQPTVRQMKVAGGWYDTTYEVYTPRIAYVPPIVDNRGTEKPEVVNQILTTDTGQANADSELAQRAANKYAARRNNRAMEVTFKDEWYFLVPDVGVWFTFSIAVADTARGIVYSSSKRWQLISISYTTDNETGRRFPTGRFLPETSSTGAFIEVTAPQETESYDIQPITAPPFTDGDFPEWWDNKDPAPPEDPNPSPATCEGGGFRVKSSAGYETDTQYLNGERLEITVRGSGKLLDGDESYDFTTSSFSGTWAGNATGMNYVASNGWTTAVSNAGRSLSFGLRAASAFAGKTITGVSFTFRTATAVSGGAPVFTELQLAQNGVPFNTFTGGAATIKSVGTHDFSWSGSEAITSDLQINLNYGQFAGIQGVFYLENIVISIGTVMGDAFYYSIDGQTWQAYDPGDGLQDNGSDVASIPPYNSNHTYTYYKTSGSGTQTYTFDTPYTTADLENWSIQTLTCSLGVP